MIKGYTLIIFFLLPTILFAQGQLDNSFGQGGKVTTNVTPSYDDYANSVIVQDDGKIIVIGYAYNGSNSNANFCLVRYNRDGNLDETFGFGGKVSTDFGSSHDIGLAGAIQNDGKIIVAGYTYSVSGTFDGNFAIARYNSDGTLDNSFGSSGKVTTDFGSTSDYAYSVAVQDDGKIVVGGYASDGISSGFALARYDPSGNLDPTLDGDGKVINNIGNGIASIKIDNNDKIVAAGYYYNGTNNDFAVMRYNSDGSLDGTFGTGGRSFANFNEHSSPSSLTLKFNGSDYTVLIAGTYYGSNPDFALAQFNDNGALDLTFGSNGKVITDFEGSNDYGRSVTTLRNGKIIIAGLSQLSGENSLAIARYNGDGTPDDTFSPSGEKLIDVDVDPYAIAIQISESDEENLIFAGRISSPNSGNDFAAAKTDEDGNLANSFGTNGIAETDLGNSTDIANAVIVQPDGKIVAAGYTFTSDHNNLALVRYNNDGSIDTTFDHDGRVFTDVGSSTQGRSVAVVDNKIFVAGIYNNTVDNDFLLNKFNSDGSADVSFQGDGSINTDISGGSNDFANSLIIQSNKKMVVAGYSTGIGGYDFTIVRYNIDGSLDMSFNSIGIVKTDFNNLNDLAYSVAIQPDDQKILAGGYSGNGTDNDLAIARYNSDGTLDNSFGTNGKVLTDIQTSNDFTRSILIQSSSKIILAGYSFIDTTYRAVLVRYNSNGNLDNTFGTGGKVITTIDGANILVSSAVLQEDDKILAVGYFSDGSNFDFIILRYDVNGNLDNSFGENGIVRIDFANSFDVALASAIQPDGKLIAAGYSFNNFSNNFAVLRYNVLFPQISLSSDTLSFGNVILNSDSIQSITIENLGTADLIIDSIRITTDAFALDGAGFSVMPGENHKVDVTFTPTEIKLYSEELIIYHNVSGNPDTLLLTGNGITGNAAAISVSPSTLIDFGEVTQNTSLIRKFTLKNIGSAELRIDSIKNIESSFSIDVSILTLEPDSSREISVTFLPQDTLNHSDTLKIYHNAAGSPTRIILNGKGTSKLIALINITPPEMLDYGEITINTSSIKKINIKNIGTGELQIDSIKNNDGTFTSAPDNFTLEPDSSKEISITFLPTDTLNHIDTLEIYSNTSGSPNKIVLNGRGTNRAIAIISLSNISNNFNNVLIGNNSTKNIIIRNIGTASLVVDSIKSNNNALSISPSSFSITPNDSLSLQITFSPTDTLDYIINLTVYHNAFGNSSNINFTGSGFSYPSSININKSIAFGEVKDINNYRIIGIPGGNEIAISSFLQGEFEYDWSVYDDNGQAENYLIKSNDFQFKPGKAYWILSGNPLNINQQENSVGLNNEDYSYTIQLQPGWNLISNPFHKSVTWSGVVSLNNLPQNSILYSWNGNWGNSSVMLPYSGYYFFNRDSLASIKIPYNPKGSLTKTADITKAIANDNKFLKIAIKENNIEKSGVFIGIEKKSEEGIDEYDFYAPPADFQKLNIRLINKELAKREGYLYIEQRPAINEGQEYNLEVKAIPNKPLYVSVEGIEEYNEYMIYLLDKRLKNLYNIKEEKEITLTLAHQLNNFKLFIGTEEFINKIKSELLPNEYFLYQNYPNPFNPSTVIRFSLPETDKISIKIFNILGQTVRLLVDNQLYNPGNYEVEFNGKDLASGVYIVSMEAANFSAQKKMVLLK